MTQARLASTGPAFGGNARSDVSYFVSHQRATALTSPKHSVCAHICRVLESCHFLHYCQMICRLLMYWLELVISIYSRDILCMFYNIPNEPLDILYFAEFEPNSSRISWIITCFNPLAKKCSVCVCKLCVAQQSRRKSLRLIMMKSNSELRQRYAQRCQCGT